MTSQGAGGRTGAFSTIREKTQAILKLQMKLEEKKRDEAGAPVLKRGKEARCSWQELTLLAGADLADFARQELTLLAGADLARQELTLLAGAGGFRS